MPSHGSASALSMTVEFTASVVKVHRQHNRINSLQPPHHLDPAEFVSIPFAPLRSRNLRIKMGTKNLSPHSKYFVFSTARP